ncbi:MULTISPECIES: NmrA family NAD(P)-binding protein [Mesonia]|uniref:NmrA family NAD(P)-binding protein n=2 Tax=Flavobacteriaceae TaxID=49546 RepID=UPI0024B9D48C|nr:NmrA family NAD(P)-binding protein [Mesonia mobilis]|tara:strand:- start:97 stop:924 length:828 start_codon:yes stop_codon:yes gene_type:complete
MKQENILVLGGTGKTGSRIVKQLKKLNHNVRIGSRKNNPPFNWGQPEQWFKVLENIDKVYISYQPDLAVPGALDAIKNLVKIAKKFPIKKLVLLSGKGEREAELCEQVIIHSGIDYTIIRASWFNQNFSESFLIEPIMNREVALPQAHIKIPFVDANDIAEVAVKVLLDDIYNGQVYQLTGVTAITFEEAINIISNAIDTPIKFTPISIEAYEATMQNGGLSKDFIWLIKYLFTEVLGNPKNAETTQDIERILNRKPITFSEYANKTAKTGVWNL